jgi:tripartite-type tricarboxylate transporter receptor subunit TctC
MPAHLPREEKLTSEDWTGILVKAGTPANLVIRLNTAIGKALQTDKVHEALAKLGVDPAGGAPEAFGSMMHDEIVRWGKIIKEANIKILTSDRPCWGPGCRC